MRKANNFQGLGLRIQQLRKARGWSQEQLAEAVGKSVNTVSNIERGVNSTRLKTIGQLADIFGVRLTDLFEEPQAATTKGQEQRREIARMIALIEGYDADTIRHLQGLVASALEVKRGKRKKRTPR